METTRIEPTICEEFYQTAPTYSSRRLLENDGWEYLDNNKLFLAKFNEEGCLRIWRAIGKNPSSLEDNCFIPVYDDPNWKPNIYTSPFNEQLKQLAVKSY